MSLRRLSSILAGPAGLVILLFFFLPWVTVSCAGTDFLEGSGYDLAQGFDEDNIAVVDFSELGLPQDASAEGEASLTLSQTDDGNAFEADAFLYLIPAFGVFAALLAGLSIFEVRIINTVTALGLLVLPGLLGLGLMALKYSALDSDVDQMNEEAMAAQQATSPEDAQSMEQFELLTGQALSSTLGVQLELEIGWWATVLGLVGLFVAGVMGFLAPPESVLQAQAPLQTLTNTSSPAMPGFEGVSSPFAPPSEQEVRAKLLEARTLVQNRDYGAARAILVGLDHPTAREWLTKLDERLGR
ncbi:MAG: hypothetical protein HC915_00435 [Anaerolineae bacterium]|nr:hypothetical protein [Anaerolineae bacterium]